MSRILSRDHRFQNTFNYVKLGRKYAYMSTEKQGGYIKVLITEKLLNAFKEENWDILEDIYMRQLA